MRLAVNFSKQGARLWKDGRIRIDAFKCPAWKDLIDQLHHEYPLYVHFPLRVGKGAGTAVNTETNNEPDWQIFQEMALQTHTPYYNLHLAPLPSDHPEIPVDDSHPEYSDRFINYMVKDINGVVEQVGSDKIIAENIFSSCGEHPLAAIRPEVVRDVIQTTNIGFLLDISHARQAARELNMDPKSYISILPTNNLREIHITGIQILNDYWCNRVLEAGLSLDKLAKYINKPIDHLPMLDEDWRFFEWALEQLAEGQWQEPDVITFEYSGIGKGFFEATTDVDVLENQVSRFYTMVNSLT